MKFYKALFLLPILTIAAAQTVTAQETDKSKFIMSKEQLNPLIDQVHKSMDGNEIALLAREVVPFGSYCKIYATEEYRKILLSLVYYIPKEHSEKIILLHHDKYDDEVRKRLQWYLQGQGSEWLAQPLKTMLEAHQKTFGGDLRSMQAAGGLAKWKSKYIQKVTGMAFPDPYCEQIKPDLNILENWLEGRRYFEGLKAKP